MDLQEAKEFLKHNFYIHSHLYPVEIISNDELKKKFKEVTCSDNQLGYDDYNTTMIFEDYEGNFFMLKTKHGSFDDPDYNAAIDNLKQVTEVNKKVTEYEEVDERD